MKEQEVTLILGGTGKTGRRIAARIERLGLPYRIGSRRGQPAFDWEDSRTWLPSLAGVSKAYVAYHPDLCVPGALETVRSFFAQAVDSGVRKLVLLSGRGEVEAEQAERALAACGADWTVLRSSFFSQNFSENFFLEPILAGDVALPVGPVPELFVDAEDVADAAVAALTQPGHAGVVYELTGPRSLTFAEAIGEIARASGRNIRYRSITPQEYRAALVDGQVPDNIIELILYLFGTVLDGRNTPVADGVERALGRAPRDFTDYVKLTASTGVWSA